MSSVAAQSRPRTLVALGRAAFWVSFPLGILSFVLPVYGEELGASAVEIGGFFSAIALVPVIVRPFLGRAMDRWGRRPFLLLGLAGYAVATFMFCLADSVWMLLTARFVQGLGQAFLWLSAYAIVADVAAESGRGHSFGLVDEAVYRGVLVGTGIGLVAIFTLEGLDVPFERVWFWLFIAYCAPALLALWGGWRGVPETRTRAAPQPMENVPVSRQLLTLMVIVFVTGASMAMVWPLLVVFVRDTLGASLEALALAYFPAAAIMSLLPSRTGRIADRLGRKGPMVAGLVTGAVASALIPHLRSLTLLAALWAVESLGSVVATPAQRAFVADVAGEDKRGTSYGLYTFAYFLGATLGPLAGGWLYDNVAQAMPFYLNAAALLLGALLVATVLREPRGRALQRGTIR
jgi:DHA1 family multidrug resistance protein-like MFS transporter